MIFRKHSEKFNHQYGWPWIQSELYKLSNLKNNILFDDFIDFTFQNSDIIYKQTWAGIVHHPSSVFNFTDNFQKSLLYCKFLIVHDPKTKLYFEEKTKVKIICLRHPIKVDFEWSYVNFDLNKSKKFLVIGQWLRNFDKIKTFEVKDPFLKNKKLIPELFYVKNKSKEEYNNLLSKNIVLLPFKDCSASNTLLECIRSCTPVITNRIKATEYYLGKEYPLYLNEPIELTEKNIYLQTFNYLKKRNLEIDLSLDFYISKISIEINQVKSHLLPVEIYDSIGTYLPSTHFFTKNYCNPMKKGCCDKKYKEIVPCCKMECCPECVRNNNGECLNCKTKIHYYIHTWACSYYEWWVFDKELSEAEQIELVTKNIENIKDMLIYICYR